MPNDVRKQAFPRPALSKTKPELGSQIIRRVVANRACFEAVIIDDLCGHNDVLRQRLDQAAIEYYGDIPASTTVGLDQPKTIYSKTKRGKRSKQPQIVAGQRCEVCELLHHPAFEWRTMKLRPSERGMLIAQFARCRVWTVHGTQCCQEWLLIRRDSHQRITYVLSNASVDTPWETMAWRKSHRDFIERDNQDSSGEMGWDKLQAITYRTCEHQFASPFSQPGSSLRPVSSGWTGCGASPLYWALRGLLPRLSVASVPEHLRAAMPLPRLSTQEATALIIEHLVNRTRSRCVTLSSCQHKLCQLNWNTSPTGR